VIRHVFLSVLLCATVLGPEFGWAQQILLDQGMRVGGLWCFPSFANAREYVYLPYSARLAADDAGRPQFSFVRYVITAPSSAATGQDTDRVASDGHTIIDADGGGILHFLVLLDTPQSMVDDAQAELRKKLKDKDIVLRGPLVFQDGRYLLVSSIVNPASATAERKLLASGRAPVLEGNRLALSFDLKPQEATLLTQSFRMNTPDVSLVFDMSFLGLSEAYDADLLIDWSEVHNSKAFGAGGSVYFVSADVKSAFDELRRTNAIQLHSRGSDSAMEGLLTSVYTKLLDLLFRPVEPEKVPPDKRGGLMETITALTDPENGPLSSRKTTGFGAYVGYQLKEMKSSGTSTLNFNHRASVERHSVITFNIGDFYKRFGKDENYFRDVNLADPMFQQREVHVKLDGALLPDFDRYINTVTVTMRKEHQNGQHTLREVVLNRQSITDSAGGFRMSYGWNGDQDRQAWLQYDYRTRWSFKGGGTYETEWKRLDAPMIDVFVPYERRVVQLVGNKEDLQRKGVRAVVVQVEYPFFSERRRHQLVVRPDKQTDEPQVPITLPLGQFDYEYTITWQMTNDRRLTAHRRDSTGLVFIDELPDGSATTLSPPGSAQPPL
jgi:hypothetical protein